MSGISKLSSFLASVATQVRAAIEVGVPVDDTAAGTRRTDECEPTSVCRMHNHGMTRLAA